MTFHSFHANINLSLLAIKLDIQIIPVLQSLLGPNPKFGGLFDDASMYDLLSSGILYKVQNDKQYSSIEQMIFHTLGHFRPSQYESGCSLDGLMDFILLNAMMKEQNIYVTDINLVMEYAFRAVLTQEHLCRNYSHTMPIFKLYGIKVERDYEENFQTPPWDFVYASTYHTFRILVSEYRYLSSLPEFPNYLNPAFNRIFANGNVRGKINYQRGGNISDPIMKSGNFLYRLEMSDSKKLIK